MRLLRPVNGQVKIRWGRVGVLVGLFVLDIAMWAAVGVFIHRHGIGALACLIAGLFGAVALLPSLFPGKARG